MGAPALAPSPSRRAPTRRRPAKRTPAKRTPAKRSKASRARTNTGRATAKRASAGPATKRASAKRAPARHATARSAPRRQLRPNQALAGAALIPHAAVRTAGAVRDLSDSSLIVRLTAGRAWIAVLCALLGGIVALNVISLSINATSGRVTQAIEEYERRNSALRAELAEKLSASRVEDAAAGLGLAVPGPESISYVTTGENDLERLANLLGGDTFLTTDYGTDDSSYTDSSYTEAAPAEAPAQPISSAPAPAGTAPTAATAPTVPAPAPAPTSSGGGTDGGATGGIGL